MRPKLRGLPEELEEVVEVGDIKGLLIYLVVRRLVCCSLLQSRLERPFAARGRAGARGWGVLGRVKMQFRGDVDF